MKALVAGFGNIFFGDDGYGVHAARLLMRQRWPDEVRVADFGIRGMHLAFELLEGYDLVLFLDTVQRGETPGTLYVIEPQAVRAAPADAHGMELHNAIAFYESLCVQLSPPLRPRLLIVACEPQSVEEGAGMSEAVVRALPATTSLVRRVLAEHGIGVQAV